MLTIKKDKILDKEWVKPIYDEKTDEIITEGYYQEINVTDRLPYLLYEPAKFDSGVTLRDFAKLLNNHRKLISILFYRNYITQWIDYIINSPESKPINEDNPTDIRKLRISVYISGKLFKDDNSYISKSFDLEAGIMDKNKVSEKEQLTEVDGEVIRYGFIGNTITEYVDRELYIDNKVSVSYSEHESEKIDSKEIILNDLEGLNLGDIIHAIFYEISFYGTPEDAKKESDYLTQISNEINKENKSLIESADNKKE